MATLLSQGITWGKEGKGRWHKRRLAKAERQAAKRQMRGLHVRKALGHARSTINYKGT